MVLGEKLYRLRKNINISQEQLAFEVEVSKTAIIKWENNKAKPSVDNLLKLCNYFETDISSLLEGVSNVNLTGAKFKGSSYAAFAQNVKLYNNDHPEILQLLIENQNKITKLLDQQSKLLYEIVNK